MPPPGYSGKSLSDKLGLKRGMRIVAHNAPEELEAWLQPMPLGAALVPPKIGTAACVLLFVTTKAELQRSLKSALAQIEATGMLWICWPKKSSGVSTDVTENVLREVVLPTGWVDVKVCAVSEIWSGLKFLRRKQNR